MGRTLTLLGYLLSLCLCVTYCSGRYVEGSSRYPNAKSKRPSPLRRIGLFFKKNGDLPERTVVFSRNAMLTCKTGGTPPPTIHWVRNGHRIEQGDMLSNTNDEAYYEDAVDKEGRPLLRRSFTNSALYLDCITPEMVGDYTCVSDTPTERIESTTFLEQADEIKADSDESCLVKRTFTDYVPARIYLWTSNRLEFSGAKVQLFCRAEGSPEPKITWMTNTRKVIDGENEEFKPLPNGDLLIKSVHWKHMGKFTCIAENEAGSDRKQMFVYPTH